MNKRQAKKQYKKTLELTKTARSKGISVAIINQGFINKNGKPCNLNDEGGHLVVFRRSKIQYIKSTDKKDL